MRFGVAGVLAVAALFGVMCGARASAECKVRQIGEIHVRMEGRQPLMEGEINGKPVDFLADTGASSSALFYSALARLGVQAYEIEGAKAFGVGGASKVSTAEVASLKLGNMVRPHVGLLVFGKDKASDSMTAGLLGADFFGQADVEFDLAHNVIRFWKPEGCKGDDVLYWPGAFSELPLLNDPNGGDAFIVNVKLNGHSLRAILDTGAATSSVTASIAQAAGISPAAMTPLKGKTYGIAGKGISHSVAVFDSFTFDQETIKSIPIEVAELFAANTEKHLGSLFADRVLDEPDMLLGADFFLAHRVLISNSQHIVFISYNGAKVFDAGEEAGAK